MWTLWTLASGCVLGIDGTSKTMVVVIQYDELGTGRPQKAAEENLRLTLP